MTHTAECQDMSAAGWLAQVARLAGYRESGVTFGASASRIMVRVLLNGIREKATTGQGHNACQSAGWHWKLASPVCT
jgi:tRNA(Phe) wybutosine-synthesizing methylase Tyw3